jgi:Co/Zn/Cd efflux system component
MGRDVHEHSHSGDDHCKKAISNYSSSQHKDDHHEHNQDHDHDNSHGHGHHDVKLKKKNICRCCHLSNTTRLAMQVILTFGFFLVELVVGHVTKSVSMTADSFHMLSDVLALLVGLASAIVIIVD